MQATKLETVTRMGFAARGIMYLLIGFLALKTGSSAGSGGALEHLNGGSAQLLLGLMALGFLGYGFWRVSEAVIDTEGQGDDTQGIIKRAAGFLSGLIHLGLAGYAVKLIRGQGGGGGDGAEQGAATALALPGGQTLLMLAAAVLFVTGVYQFVKAIKLGFLRHLEQQAAREGWVRWAGRLGYAARGAVFLVISYFLWNAAREASAEQAGSTGEALQSLSPTVQAIVAAGLMLFGLFSLVEARYRRINNPRVLERLRAGAEASQHR